MRQSPARARSAASFSLSRDWLREAPWSDREDGPSRLRADNRVKQAPTPGSGRRRNLPRTTRATGLGSSRRARPGPPGATQV